MKARFKQTVIAAVTAISLALGAAALAQAPRVSRTDPPSRQPSKFLVVPLKDANATQAVEVLSNLFVGRNRGDFGGGGQAEMIIADPRTNSLVIRASEDVLQQVTEMIKVLDAPQPPEAVKIFQLLHASAGETQTALAPLVGPNLKIAVDVVGNRIIAQGDEKSLAMMEALLIKLDEPPQGKEHVEAAPASAEDVQVRLVWLVAGLKDSPAAPPPADLENVVKELEQMGVKGLKTAAQVFVKAVPMTPFAVSGSAMLDQPCNLEVNGTFGGRRAERNNPFGRRDPQPTRPAPPSTALEISISATTEDGPHLADLQTTITAPEGESVVLGVSPVGELTSVFVVQLRR